MRNIFQDFSNSRQDVPPFSTVSITALKPSEENIANSLTFIFCNVIISIKINHPTRRTAMKNNFGSKDWKNFVPIPVCEEHPEYFDFYIKAWSLAFDHIKDIPGMPQNPYMDEAFCATQVWIWDTCFMSLFCKYAREVFPGVETFKNFYEVLYGDKRLPMLLSKHQKKGGTHLYQNKMMRLVQQSMLTQ